MTDYYIPGAVPAYAGPGQGFRLNGVNYPPGWLSPLDEEGLALIGAVAPPAYDPKRQSLTATPAGWAVQNIARPARLEAQEREARAECKARIYRVVNAQAQLNLAAAAGAGRLDAAALGVYGQILTWIDAMRTRCREIAGDLRRDPQSDAAWPSIEEEARAGWDLLINRY